MENHASHVHNEGAASVRKNGKSNLLVAAGAVAVILIIVAVANFGGNLFGGGMKNISPDEAKARAEKFINENLVSGTTATITSVEDYNASLYKFNVKVGDNTIESFMTKDGITFLPQGMALDGSDAAAGATNTAAATPVVPADLVKSDKPEVVGYVMSLCPYGTQFEKGILPVLEALGNKIDFKLKFVSYAMHGIKEVNENMNQDCIMKEEPAKFNAYLKCYLVAGDSTGCASSTGLNTGKISSCVKALDSQYKITESFNDKTKWDTGSFPPYPVYKADNERDGVQGSPTFVINGKQVESNRDPQSLLTTICAAFNNAPEECKKQLDNATPGPGFGTTTAAATGGSAAACAPAT